MWGVLARLAERGPEARLGEGLEVPEPIEVPEAWTRHLHGDAVADLRALLDAAPLEARIAPAFARWLRLVAPYVLERVRSALEVEAVADVVDELVRPARLHLTRSHVDVVFDLEAISLPVRRAGLDRDPGWLPEYRRVVSFHYV